LNNNSFSSAAAHGLPIVTTTHAALEPHFVHGENVFLCEPQDPAALASAVAAVVDNPDLRARLREGALRFARDWCSWETAMDKTLRIFGSAEPPWTWAQFEFMPRTTEALLRLVEIGLFLEARREFADINFSASIVIGDARSDMEAGQRLGCRTILIGQSDRYPSAPTLYDAVVTYLAVPTGQLPSARQVTRP
jgi:hypothetical protein